ncbi:unnamed protein product [Phaeothamnion confervicola]
MAFRLVVKNIPFSMDVEACAELFSNLSPDAIELKTRTNGASRGMCWLYFTDFGQAEVAYETLRQGATMAGLRTLMVERSHDLHSDLSEDPLAVERRARRRQHRLQRRAARNAMVPRVGPSPFDNVGPVEKYEQLMAGVPLEQMELADMPKSPGNKFVLDAELKETDLFQRATDVAEMRLQRYMSHLHLTMEPPSRWEGDPLGKRDVPERYGRHWWEEEAAAEELEDGDGGGRGRFDGDGHGDGAHNPEMGLLMAEGDSGGPSREPDRAARVFGSRSPEREEDGESEDDEDEEELGEDWEVARVLGEEGKADLVLGDWAETIIDQDRVNKVMGGGRLMRWRALVVAGNNRGVGGFGMGKATNPKHAVLLASRAAKRLPNLIHVDRWKQSTLLHPVMGKHNNCRVYIRPRPPGEGITASGTIEAILTQMGIGSFSAKAVGNRNPYSVVRATFDALKRHRGLEDYALGRGKRILTISRQLEGAPKTRAWRAR